MRKAQKTGSDAFSLVELMVAIAVAIIVGGAILSALLHTFGVWETVGGKTGELNAMDDFDIAFSRDFAAAEPRLGFQGSSTECQFWTHRPTPNDAPALILVKYSITPEGTFSETWKCNNDAEKDGVVTRYATATPASFRFGDTNMLDSAWTVDWQSTSNAPVAVTIDLNSRPPMPQIRLYERRTP